jgi:hypothetical protein
MENVNPEDILRKLEKYLEDPPTCFIYISTQSRFGPQNYIVYKNNGVLFVDNTEFDGDINDFVVYLSTTNQVIWGISFIFHNNGFKYPFKMYSEGISYYGCDEKMVTVKFALFKEYAKLIGCVDTLKDFIAQGLKLVKQKAENSSMEQYNKESAYQKEKEQLLFNDTLLRKITRNASFGAESYDIDYTDTHDFTCDGENEFNIRLRRFVEITLPQRIKTLNGEIIEIYSKIPNNKEVLPQFVKLMNTALENKMYTTFTEQIIGPMEHLLGMSSVKHKKKQRELITETASLRGGLRSLSFGKRNKLQKVNGEITFLKNIKIKGL